MPPTSESASTTPVATLGSVASITIDSAAEATTTAVRCDQGAGGSAPPSLDVAYRLVPGVDANLTSLDVYPGTSPCAMPVVVWVHGGAYAIGDKSNQIADKVSLFNGAGWVLVSVNYRLTTGGPGSARFPDHYNDVATAIRWVRDNIATFGGDPARIAVLGHSAGADIVSNVVVNPVYLAEVGVALSDIACAGPLDTEGFDKQASNDGGPVDETDQWLAALGNNPDYLTATSATGLIKPDIGIPPMIGVVRGGTRRQQIEAAFLDRLVDNGIAATAIDASTLSHADVARLIGAPGDTVMTSPLMQFLTACFAS
jgi:arylformamidase